MKGVEYKIRLRGLATPEGTIPISTLIKVAQAILDGSRRALQLLMEGVSVKRGRVSASLGRSLDFNITGLSKGSTVVEIEVPTFEESAPEIVNQLNLWNMLMPRLRPEDTAISVLSKSVRDAAAGELESEYYDKGVLEALSPLKSLLKEKLSDIRIECPTRSSEKFGINETEMDRISRVEAETPEPRAMVVAGIFNSIEHTHRKFGIVMSDGHKIRGIAEAGYIDTENMRYLWGKKVTVKGLAHFKPSGAMRSIEADVIKPFERGEELFENVSRNKPSSSLIQNIQREQGVKNPLTEVWGKWPGDESIDEILDTLKRTSREAI